jgi:THO complex subunit 5
VDGSIADAEALVRKAAAEEETARARERGGDDAEAADAMETDDGEIRGEIRDKREGDDDDGGDADADADADAGGGRAKKRAKRGASDGGGGGKGAFYLTLVPIRPRRRGERRSLRTFPGASLRPGSLAHNPDTHRCRSTPTDAIQLHPGRTSGTGGGDDANETYAQHPLVVVLDVDGVSFVFRYLMNLHVVTVEAMKTDEKKKRAGRATKEKEEKGRARGGGDANAADAPPPVDLTRGDLLVNLFPDDDGLDTPNAANKLRYPAGFAYPDVSTRRDRPYKWAQARSPHAGSRTTASAR